MKIALSVWNDYISTVFDTADQLLVLEIDGKGRQKRTTVELSPNNISSRSTQLKDQGIGVLICGAISWHLQAAITALGIVVYPFVRGSVEEIIAAYQSNQLSHDIFSLPGCRRNNLTGTRGQYHGRLCRGRQQYPRSG